MKKFLLLLLFLAFVSILTVIIKIKAALAVAIQLQYGSFAKIPIAVVIMANTLLLKILQQFDSTFH